MSGNTDDKQIDAQADGVNGNGDAVEPDVEPAGGATPNVGGGDEKREAVKQTIAEIKSENAPKVKKKYTAIEVALTVVAVLLFPFTLIVLGVRALFKKFRLGITAKTTVIFTLVFGLMIIGYSVFVLASINKLVGSGEGLTAAYMHRLIITS